jgi:altronate hydrolase
MMMERPCTHSNVGAVVLVSLGCESFNRTELAEVIEVSGRPVETFVIQKSGGSASTIEAGREAVARAKAEIADVPRVPMTAADLVVGTVRGGSDGTSGISGNPEAGRAFDRLVAAGPTCIFEETGELIGCEKVMADRAVTPELGAELKRAVEKAARSMFCSTAPGWCTRAISWRPPMSNWT